MELHWMVVCSRRWQNASVASELEKESTCVCPTGRGRDRDILYLDFGGFFFEKAVNFLRPEDKVPPLEVVQDVGALHHC